MIVGGAVEAAEIGLRATIGSVGNSSVHATASATVARERTRFKPVIRVAPKVRLRPDTLGVVAAASGPLTGAPISKQDWNRRRSRLEKRWLACPSPSGSSAFAGLGTRA